MLQTLFTIGIFHKPFGAQRPVNTGASERVIFTGLSLHTIIYFLSKIDVMLSSASTPKDTKFWLTGIVFATLDLIGRLSG